MIKKEEEVRWNRGRRRSEREGGMGEEKKDLVRWNGGEGGRGKVE